MDKDKISVSVMQPQDVPALVEIDAIAGGAPRAEYLQGKARQALDGEHGMVISLVAESAGNAVGFLMGEVYSGEFGIPETVATVDTIGVHPAYQGKGVARLLLDELLVHLRKAGVERIRTLVEWEQWDLVGFFQHMDFRPGTSILLERSLVGP